MASPAEEKTPHVVVIGLDCMTGLQTARILARHRIPVLGIARDPKHPCCRTNVCKQIVSADTSGPEFIGTLEKLAESLEQKAVLYPCTDTSVLLISRERQRLQHTYHVVLPEPDAVELLMNKVSFYIYARNEGFSVPRTFLLRTRKDAERAANELDFPCILKPASRTAFWERQTRLKVYRLSSPEQLVAVYDRCSEWAEALLVQEWIEGSDSDLYSCNCYFDSESQPLVSFTARKLRQWPPEAGTSCLGEECRNDVVRDETVRLFQNVRLRGLGYLEMKVDRRTGRHIIIEPNIGRPTGRSAIAEAGGVELLYAMYCDVTGRPLPENLEQRYRGVKWIYFRRDLQSAFYYWRRNQLTMRDWARSWQGLKADALFSWRDPVPFFADFKKASSDALFRGKRTVVVEESRHREARPQPGMRSGVAEPARARPALPSEEPRVDFDIHGLVGVRLLNPTPGDVAAVARQLGPLEATLTREPDILVRFVKSLPTPNLRYVGLDRQGFTEDGYFILRSSKASAKVRVDFEQVGRQCEIVCESGLRSVPLLMALLNLTVLKKDCVPLHASAFQYEGKGILVTGWAKGGKTEALLAFGAHGARYVGDEWVILSGDGQKMYGVPERIRLWDWHLDQLAKLRREIGRETLAVFRMIRWLDQFQQIAARGWMKKTLPVRLLAEGMPALKRQLNVQLEPRAIFNGKFGPLVAEPQKVFLMVTHQDSTVEVESCDPAAVAGRMVSSIRYEQLPLFEHYLAFKYAFPEKKSGLIERAHELQREILGRAVAGKEAYVVRHPYPVSLERLFEAMRPFVVGGVRSEGPMASVPKAGLAEIWGRQGEQPT